MRFTYSYRKMDKLFANSEDPDQTPRSAASDLGLHCLPVTLLGISRLQLVNYFLSASMQELVKIYNSGNSAVDISIIVNFW